MEHEFDGAVVVGAGPSGAKTAEKLSENNIKTLVIEEDNSVGNPVQCAGIVSTRTIEESELKKDNYIQNRVRGAKIHSPNGESIEISRPETQAYIIDRSQFDRKLIESAVQSGANLKLGWRAVNWNGKTLEISTPKNNTKTKKIKPKVVVGADGVKSTIRRSINLPRPQKYLSGAQLTITGTEIEKPDFVEIFLGQKTAPGFFAWSIPTDRKTTRIGLCIDPEMAKKPATEYLKNLIKNHPKLKKHKDKELEWNYGAIPIGYPSKLYDKKTLLVGDAAGQVKPTTGGGVYTGMVCGKTAAKTINRYLDGETQLKEYDTNWRKKLGRELKIGMSLHKTLCSLSDKELDKLIKKLDNPKLIKTIENYGDMDYPSKVAIEILKTKPSLIKYFGVFTTKLLGDLL
ncbi:Geranylgeranyl reductase flavoprotein [Methanonatronarchaeum thermophilum]|uniref:Geranylgeranyl reductase flavoprotein n=1 Tax=Methanonatronarchaeum thermophilum TaxID=1927129 RepID=A0A1Y3GIG7_9EURY|nr:NAD(P)/FAD-dependent oxidoreductase [Methanonatronarchaeum thermophilum]OUJ19196.1 Geranylgeranyl reductase flavoprotein [Methanonatronarchaeum thermophilum]